MLALDDAGVCTFATHRVFESFDAAKEYADTVAHHRLPMICYAEKPFYRKYT